MSFFRKVEKTKCTFKIHSRSPASEQWMKGGESGEETKYDARKLDSKKTVMLSILHNARSQA